MEDSSKHDRSILARTVGIGNSALKGGSPFDQGNCTCPCCRSRDDDAFGHLELGGCRDGVSDRSPKPKALNPNPYPLRTHEITLLGPKTHYTRLFGLL